MQTKHLDSQTQTLGDAVVAAFDLGNTVGCDRATAGELAARHLARVLVLGSNARLAATIAKLARELTPTRARVGRGEFRALGRAA